MFRHYNLIHCMGNIYFQYNLQCEGNQKKGYRYADFNKFTPSCTAIILIIYRLLNTYHDNLCNTSLLCRISNLIAMILGSLTLQLQRLRLILWSIHGLLLWGCLHYRSLLRLILWSIHLLLWGHLVHILYWGCLHYRSLLRLDHLL